MIRATCPCGATFEVDVPMSPAMLSVATTVEGQRLDAWLARHNPETCVAPPAAPKSLGLRPFLLHLDDIRGDPAEDTTEGP